MVHDPHGQPFNIRCNRARRAERDLSEFLGLTKGFLADGTVTVTEAELVYNWVATHPSAAEQWPLNHLVARLHRVFGDGRVDEEERRELAELLQAIVGGSAGVIMGEDAATELPLDAPPPQFTWRDATFVFTGKFALGTRSQCQQRVVALGAVCDSDVTRRTNYLVIGTFGSRHWVHTSFGRKIEKAVSLREAGVPSAVTAEDHWVGFLEREV